MAVGLGFNASAFPLNLLGGEKEGASEVSLPLKQAHPAEPRFTSRYIPAARNESLKPILHVRHSGLY